MKQVGRFDAIRPGWEFRPVQGDLNATTEKAQLEFNIEYADGRSPIVTGGSFNLWSPDASHPYAYASMGLRTHLTAKFAKARKNRRSAYFMLPYESHELPMDRARIAFRDITNQENQRTTIACLLPPGTAAVNAAPVLVTRQGGPTEEAFLLGVMCSIPFDWASRRWVERHLNFWILNPLPVPPFNATREGSRRVVHIAGRLAAVDHRYAAWGAAVGVPVGSVVSAAVKDDLLAELDALVSLLYGLTESQVRHVFATFHRGWNYKARLDAVLKHYRDWKGKE